MNPRALHGWQLAFRHRIWMAAIGMLVVMLLARIDVASADEATAPKSDVQFGGQCTEGLAEGKHVMTKCATRWTDKDGKVYCFSGEDAKKSFLQNSTENLQRARDFIAASSVETTEKSMQYFSNSDAEALVRQFIADKTKANGGSFPLDDPLNGEHLQLALDDIDFTRTIDGYGFFPDVKFHDQRDSQRNYLIDFWVAPTEGQLQIRKYESIKSHSASTENGKSWHANRFPGGGFPLRNIQDIWATNAELGSDVGRGATCSCGKCKERRRLHSQG